MRMPSNWNGTLIRDLDYASGASNPRWAALLEKGYALSGTGRHRLRLYQYDPVREIANLDRVLGMFDQRFGRPKRVIQYGCSGGGAVGLFVAEDFSNRIDGVIASAAHIPVWQMNTFLDGWFVLKALIAPDLSHRGSSRSSVGRRGPRNRRRPARGVAAGDQCGAADAGGTRTNRAGLYHRPVACLGGAPADSPTGARGHRCAPAQHVPHALPQCREPWWRGPDQEGAGRQRAAVVVEHRRSIIGSSSRTATSPSSARFGSCIRRPVWISTRTLDGSTRFPASRLPPTRSSGGTRLAGQRKALRRFHCFGCTKSAISRCRSAWCRAMGIWFAQTAKTTCIASPS